MTTMRVPQPCFFVVRPDTKQTMADGRVQTIPGPIVPLIAVDELPAWIDIAGVPRELTVEEAIGLHNLGVVDKSNAPYAVKIIHDATPAARQQAASMRNAEVKPASDAAAAGPQASAHPTPAPSSDSKTLVPATAAPVAIHQAGSMKSHCSKPNTRSSGLTSSIHNTQQPQPQAQQSQTLASPTTSGHSVSPATNTGSTAVNNSKGTPTPGSADSPATPTKMEYCRHWCHYGTCKFDFECRHLHAMPTTAAELAEVGLTEIPRWYIVATAAAAGRRHFNHLLRPRDTKNSHGGHRGLINIGLGGGGGAAVAAAATVAGGGDGDGHATLAGLDPRDVRVSTMRQLGLLPPAPTQPPAPEASAASLSAAAAPLAGSQLTLFPTLNKIRAVAAEHRAAGAGSRKVTTEQVRKPLALLTQLGISVGAGHEHGGRKMKKRGREINPLQKGQGRGTRAGKEALLKAARAEMAATAAAAVAAAGGRVRTGLVVAPVDGAVGVKGDEKGKEEDEKVATGSAEATSVQTAPAAQAASVQKVVKLVDV